MPEKIVISTLPKTWILDLDGTIVKHNGYKLDGEDTFLPGAEAFLKSVPPEDMIIFLTSRKAEYRCMTEKFLREHEIRFAHLICEMPYGERILINDRKPSGLKMTVAVTPERDEFMDVIFEADELL